MMNMEYDRGFIASFIDTDGCISFRKDRNYSPEVSFINNDRKILLYINQRLYQYKITSKPKRLYHIPPRGLSKKIGWRLVYRGKDTQNILKWTGELFGKEDKRQRALRWKGRRRETYPPLLQKFQSMRTDNRDLVSSQPNQILI